MDKKRTPAQLEADKRRSEKLRAFHASRDEIKKAAEGPIALSTHRDVFADYFRRLTIERIISALDSTHYGRLDQWMDLVDRVHTDADLRGLIEIRLNIISGKNMRVEAADKSTLGIAAESFISGQIKRIRGFVDGLKHLASALFSGVAVLEVIWQFDPLTDTYYIDCFKPVLGRKINIDLIDGEWKYLLAPEYVADEYKHLMGPKGLDVQKHLPCNFIIHSPDTRMLPHDRGLLRAAVELFLFKRLGWGYYVSGAQKHAFPKLWATVPPNTEQDTKTTLANNLRAFTSEGNLVVEDGVEINSLGDGAVAGQAAWQGLIADVNASYAKLIVGGTLNVETDGKGSYALGSVHADVRMDLAESDAESLQETIKHQLIIPLLVMNLHRFHGDIPPVPTVWFDVHSRGFKNIEPWMAQIPEAFTINELLEDLGLPKKEHGDRFITEKGETKTSQIFQYHLQGKIVTRNDVRRQLGLRELPDDQGGNELLDISPGGNPEAALSTDTYFDGFTLRPRLDLEAKEGGDNAEDPLADPKWGTIFHLLKKKEK